MQTAQLRTSAFGGTLVRSVGIRSRVSRGQMVVRAVQDLQGTVVSTSMQQSAVVAVERLSPHDTYFKRVRITKKYIVQDDVSINVGDYVRLEGCRPLSKTKRFRVAEVLRKAD